jgi:methionine-rich copper-binding protein CopC
MRRRRYVAALLAGALVLAPLPVVAHAFLVKSSPTRRATLSQPPSRVDLIFNERLEPAYSSVSVWSDASNIQVDLRDATVVAAEPRRLSVSLPSLPSGTYTVRFRVLSIDGHVVESTFPFTIASRR